MDAGKVSKESISEEERLKIKKILDSIIERKVEKTSKLHKNEKKFLQEMLQRRKEGNLCHYCKIFCGEDGEKFVKIWGKGCYGKKGIPNSGRKRLEIEHKNEHKDGKMDKNLRIKKLWEWDNLALACPICNIAKSDQFTEEEFTEVGKVVNRIWRRRDNPKEN